MAFHDPYTPARDTGPSDEISGYPIDPPEPGYDETQYDRRPLRVWSGFAGWSPEQAGPTGGNDHAG